MTAWWQDVDNSQESSLTRLLFGKHRRDGRSFVELGRLTRHSRARHQATVRIRSPSIAPLTWRDETCGPGEELQLIRALLRLWISLWITRVYNA
jgi:hypothetical protein